MNGKVPLYDGSVMAVVKSGVVIVTVCDESGNITCELLFEAEGETKDIASDCYNQDKLDGVLDLPEVSGMMILLKQLIKCWTNIISDFYIIQTHLMRVCQCLRLKRIAKRLSLQE